MKKTVLVLTERFTSSAPPDRKAVQRAVAAWLSGVRKA